MPRKNHRKKRRMWFKSSFIVLLILFLASWSYGLWKFGLGLSFETGVRYVMGFSLVAVLAFILSWLLYRKYNILKP